MTSLQFAISCFYSRTFLLAEGNAIDVFVATVGGVALKIQNEVFFPIDIPHPNHRFARALRENALPCPSHLCVVSLATEFYLQTNAIATLFKSFCSVVSNFDFNLGFHL